MVHFRKMEFWEGFRFMNRNNVVLFRLKSTKFLSRLTTGYLKLCMKCQGTVKCKTYFF